MSAFTLSEIPGEVLTPEQESAAMRVTRGYLLNECDWTQLTDNSLTLEEKAQWAAYRQELREITKNPSWPYIQWPTKPWEIT